MVFAMRANDVIAVWVAALWVNLVPVYVVNAALKPVPCKNGNGLRASDFGEFGEAGNE